ncbi:hypothetical protein I350_04034 [Cryptococcus amylolentus CBS 6273]|uniref:Uncharacterized protein n=1 Tax=Cryptococcus amylolentus CBS 6273 TaxID=1296118 RepID=A0A1E3K0U7_9TREE|nr:hypothetical protein I350_04034 [Cryptococcus amylolentus CBS 6273]
MDSARSGKNAPPQLSCTGLDDIFPPEIVSQIWHSYVSNPTSTTLHTLVRVCKSLFHRYTPTLYAHVELSHRNVLSFFHGLGGEFGPSGADISGIERVLWYDRRVRKGCIARRIALLGMVEDAVICDGAAYEACLRALKRLDALGLQNAPDLRQTPELQMTSYDPHVLFPGIHLKIDLEFRDKGSHSCGHLIFAQEALAYIQTGREDNPPTGDLPFSRLCCNKAAMVFQFPHRISLLLVEYVAAMAQAYEVSDLVLANLLPTEVQNLSVNTESLCFGLRERDIYDMDYHNSIALAMAAHCSLPRRPQFCVYVEDHEESLPLTIIRDQAVGLVNQLTAVPQDLPLFSERNLDVVDRSHVWKDCLLCRRYLFPQLYSSGPAPSEASE